MPNYTFESLKNALPECRFLVNIPNTEIKHLSNDSRNIVFPEETLFVALKTERKDGHAFIPGLLASGVKHFLVDDTFATVGLAANFIVAEKPVFALQQLAAWHRKHFSMPVLGITGSNGKTIIKEWLSELLAEYYALVKSPKSYNSQIGVPISVWQMEKSHDFAIFEAGISKPGEMEMLEKVIQPSLGLLTNIGPAHDEGFENRNIKLQEKLGLFKNCESLIFHGQQLEYNPIIESFCTSNEVKPLPWIGYTGKEISNQNGVLQIPEIYLPGPFPENVGHCIAVLWHLGFEEKVILEKIKKLHALPKRLSLKSGKNNCLLVDDSYSNDLAGLKVALQFMQQQEKKGLLHKVVILSDFLESGLQEEELYPLVSNLLTAYQINTLLAVGPALKSFSNYADFKVVHFETVEKLLGQLPETIEPNSLILIKGSRKFEFERIVLTLEQKAHGTRYEVNLDALVHNLNFYRSILKPETKLMAMVKALSYGAGSDEIARVLQFHGVDYLAVAYADEGVKLRESGIRLPIMVMNPASEDFANLLKFQLEPEIYTFSILNEFCDFLQSIENQSEIGIHLKLDTGMKRLGFEAPEIETLAEKLEAFPLLKVKTIFTHLAAADAARHDDFTKQQLAAFAQGYDLLCQHLKYQPIRHVLNSAGIVRHSEAQFEMVRLGIGLYGVEAAGVFENKLRTTGKLRTQISQIKHLQIGETVGYNRSGIAKAPTTIATIAIGYGDGFARRLSNGKGKVKINGHWVPVIGNVCMDMTMVDVTGIPASVGDEVVIFDDLESLQALASSMDTIPYEILTSIGERVKRIFYWE